MCCQFDFKRLDGRIGCPWGAPAQVITPTNVDERASLLLDQYRKKAQLYGGSSSSENGDHNLVLVPLGDDFRYTDMREAHDQFENYERLMSHINANTQKFNAHVRFGTLDDYFTALKAKNRNLDTLTGDFFTYADRQDHYWSGYYTSRPFNKRLERLVEAYLRTSELLFSITHLLLYSTNSTTRSVNTNKELAPTSDELNALYAKLMEARRHLALFQHHDGITGTSKTPVVEDYAQK